MTHRFALDSGESISHTCFLCVSWPVFAGTRLANDLHAGTIDRDLTMYSDSIIDEIRKYRKEYAARFNYDIKEMVADLKRRQKESGRPTVSRPPKRTAPVNEPASNGSS